MSENTIVEIHPALQGWHYNYPGGRRCPYCGTRLLSLCTCPERIADDERHEAAIIAAWENRPPPCESIDDAWEQGISLHLLVQPNIHGEPMFMFLDETGRLITNSQHGVYLVRFIDVVEEI